jgi:adenylate kinase
VVNLSVPDDVLLQRILARGEGRADDTEETVARRLAVYRRDTAPVLEHFRSALLEVDGQGTIDEINQRIREALGV